MSKTIKNKQAVKKASLLKRLAEVPIIEIACKRVGISRSTFYRWKKEDLEFLRKVDSERQKGISLINDMAESQLISKIKEGKMTGIIFWLKHRHKDYAQRMEITATANGLSDNEIDELSNLLFSETTLVDGQKKLMSYVVRGKLTDKFAQLILRSLATQLKAEKIFSRKAEAAIMSKVFLRKEMKKNE